MNPITATPPYGDLEVERMARALANGEAFGAWFASKETPVAFGRAIEQLDLPSRVDMIERGCVYLVEFAPGARLDPEEVPSFQTMRWLDADSTKLLLTRTLLIEAASRGLAPGVLEKIGAAVDTHDEMRRKALPTLREKYPRRWPAS